MNNIQATLKIYSAGYDKDYQREGNYQNYSTGMPQINRIDIPSFISDWFDYVSVVTISSFKLYKLTESGLSSAYNNTDLIALRDAGTTLNPALISIEYDPVRGKARIYCYEQKFAALLECGIFELVIVTNLNTLKSELFSTSMYYNANLAEGVLSCSDATCADIVYGAYPVFTIDITELNGYPVNDETLTLRFYYTESDTFDGIILDEWVFSDDNSYEEFIEDISLTASQLLEFTKTFEKTLKKGRYAVEYEASWSGCAGSITYDVNKPYFTEVLGEWAHYVNASGLSSATFEFTVENTDDEAQICEVAFQLNDGQIYIYSFEITAGGTHKFERTFTVDRNVDNTVRVYADCYEGNESKPFTLTKYTPV